MNKRNTIWHFSILAVLSATLAFTTSAVAQDSDADAVAPEPTLTAVSQRLATQDEIIAELQTKLQQLEDASATRDEKTEALEEQNKSIRAELDVAKQERDDLQFQVVSNMEKNAERLSLSGFMDFNFMQTIPQTDDSVVYAGTPLRHNSFLINNINLYFTSNVSGMLSTLVEVRFTFSPLGNNLSLPAVVYTNGQEPARIGEYSRVSTRVTEPLGRTLDLGGIYIERAHFDITPRDWFQIRLGRYLTPYGIWNEDHAPTVTLTGVMPWLQVLQYVPTAQTGVMIYGQIYPSDSIVLQYAVTLSNGRNPTESFYDMDDNKAIGTRAKLTFSKNDFELALGGYGYFGKYTDWTQEIKVYMTQQYGLDPNYDPPLRTRDVITEEYNELIGAADLEVKYKGIRLAGEFVWRKIDYKTPPESPFLQPLFLSNDPNVTTYEGDTIARSGYGLLSYTLPLKLESTTITPFVGIDMFAPDDATDYDTWITAQLGVNVKPGAYVTLKGTGYVLRPKSDFYGGLFSGYALQMAVSF
ncbi:MAG: hypothetical protein JXX14_02650 [Deltaproteobacteria bacterium]|nr:hypothetical protein [Deltaproteobacteria bacterium]